MPLTNLRLPKSKPSQSEQPVAAPEFDRPKYPYGTTISLDEETLDKFNDLMNSKAGDAVLIVAVGKIKEVRSVDTESGVDARVEIQLTEMDIKQPSQDKDTIMAEAFATATSKK